jgi:transcriptional regulator with XRE-family HTH domain
MGDDNNDTRRFTEVGQRIQRLRKTRGLSRRELAERLHVDVTSLAGWEAGKRLPRDGARLDLARQLGSDVEALFALGAETASPVLAASVVDTVEDLPELLMDLTRNTKNRMRALRLAAPYPTTAYMQCEWRKLVSQRLLDDTLEVMRIEIFYELKRLQEVLANVLRYDGHRYYVKSFCPGQQHLVPAMGGYFFDDDEFLIGAYWATLPPHNRPGLRVSGAPFRSYYNQYWDEIWHRGRLLNRGGAHDLSEVRETALALGLAPGDWDKFVGDARTLEVGDGAPPLV